MAIAETADLWLTRQEAGSDLLEQAVSDSLEGVKFLAGRLANRLPAHVDIEDLVQVGLLGLLQCAQRYDPDRGVKFQTYANRRVQGAMLDYLRSLDWRPRSVRKRSRRLAQAVSAVEQRTGGSASEEDLAAEIGLSSPELRDWLMDSSSRGEHSGLHPTNQRTEMNSEDLLSRIADPADSPESIVEKAELCQRVREAIGNLPENERIVLTLYYYEQRTMREIGRQLGVKQARVSQLHSQGLRRLRLRLRRQRSQSQPVAQPVAQSAPQPRPPQVAAVAVASPSPEAPQETTLDGCSLDGRTEDERAA